MKIPVFILLLAFCCPVLLIAQSYQYSQLHLCGEAYCDTLCFNKTSLKEFLGKVKKTVDNQITTTGGTKIVSLDKDRIELVFEYHKEEYILSLADIKQNTAYVINGSENIPSILSAFAELFALDSDRLFEVNEGFYLFGEDGVNVKTNQNNRIISFSFSQSPVFKSLNSELHAKKNFNSLKKVEGKDLNQKFKKHDVVALNDLLFKSDKISKARSQPIIFYGDTLKGKAYNLKVRQKKMVHSGGFLGKAKFKNKTAVYEILIFNDSSKSIQQKFFANIYEYWKQKDSAYINNYMNLPCDLSYFSIDANNSYFLYDNTQTPKVHYFYVQNRLYQIQAKNRSPSNIWKIMAIKINGQYYNIPNHKSTTNPKEIIKKHQEGVFLK